MDWDKTLKKYYTTTMNILLNLYKGIFNCKIHIYILNVLIIIMNSIGTKKTQTLEVSFEVLV